MIGAPGPLQPGPHHLYPGKMQSENVFFLQLIFFISFNIKYEIVGCRGHAFITGCFKKWGADGFRSDLIDASKKGNRHDFLYSPNILLRAFIASVLQMEAKWSLTFIFASSFSIKTSSIL